MAVELSREDVAALVAVELASSVRYRVLVLQSSDMSELARLVDYAFAASSALGSNPYLLDSLEFFDDIGAISCDSAWERISEAAKTRPIVLAGPLHFLDFWSDVTRNAFWRTLASFSSGPGILVVDVPRTDGIEGPFRLVGRVGDTDIRLLKSRLSVTQDSVA